NDAIAAAMRAVALTPGLGRGAADAALAAAVPQAGIRAFLLQNLQLGPAPHWRIGIDEIAAAIPSLEGWEELDGIYAGPTVFVTGASSDYVRPEHRPAIRAHFPSARFVAVKHAGHWLHVDNPAGFLSVLEAFLNA
ncbi:MAG TPA: alpha/beta fold hydrolase, partial [Acetobacteraceae bacterium]